MAVVLSLNSHGAASYSCQRAGFVVPEFVAFSFYYDPTNEDTLVCITDSQVPTICAKAPIKIFRPGDTCIDLVLSRLDDIGQKTGFYNCTAGLWYPIPGLEGSTGSVDPNPANIPSATTCLSTIAQFLNNNSLMERNAGMPPTYFDVRVLTCAITTKMRMHPTRQILYNPATGSQMTLEQNARQQAMAYYQQLVPTMGDYAAQAQAEQYYQKLLTGRARKTRRIRRKRTKTLRTKNKSKK